MNEQNNNTEKKEKTKKPMAKEKRFYLITGISSAAALVAIVLIAVLVSAFAGAGAPTAGGNSSTLPPVSSENGDQGELEDPDEPVITTPEGMRMPLASVNVLHEFGFYHNKTLNSFHEHTGMDFTAQAGAEVLAVEDGVVVSIYRDDVLMGTEITVDHGDGMKTVYRYVDAANGLKVGKEVKKGDVIATVAEAVGDEYKEGPHLHFEVIKSGEKVDPSTYLTFEEK